MIEPSESLDARFVRARRAENRARARWYATLDEFQARTTATSIVGLALDELSDHRSEIAAMALRKIRQRPAVVAASLAEATLFVLRRPLARSVAALFSRRRATSAADYPLGAQLDARASAMPNLREVRNDRGEMR